MSAALAGEIEPTLVAVLSDINMPGTDGLQLLGEIKQRFPDLPVMMVTAYGDDERCRRAVAYGAADFLTKPLDFEHLKAQRIRETASRDTTIYSRLRHCHGNRVGSQRRIR